jgi:hypothetical protein
MDWNQIVDKMTPYVVKIETPHGHGTGFLCLRNEDRSMIGIATANHVVAHADQWQQPVRITQQSSNTTIFAKESERVILSDAAKDSAVILIFQTELKLPQDLIPLLPPTSNLPIGVEVGWLGFPGIASDVLCFFSGSISARRKDGYFIDGVAINGVSGGPVVYSTPTDGIQIVGNISAYMPNYREGSTALPGLCIAQDVSHFTNMASFLKSADEARKKKHILESSEASTPPQLNPDGAPL